VDVQAFTAEGPVEAFYEGIVGRLAWSGEVDFCSILVGPQVHRVAGELTATHTNHANPFFERQLNAMTQSFKAMGMGAAEASHRALAQLSAQVDLQANVLGFVNAFWLMGLMGPSTAPHEEPSPEEAKASAAAH
jgi:hypothetical protein